MSSENDRISCHICKRTYFDRPYGITRDSAARVCGWARIEYEDGTRYVCPSCRSRKMPRRGRRPAVTQLSLLDSMVVSSTYNGTAESIEEH